MKKITNILFLVFLMTSCKAQTPTILSKEKINVLDMPFVIQKYLKDQEDTSIIPEGLNFTTKTNIEKITYNSDGLKVKGYLVQPVKKGKYPCVIYNRGGNNDFGKITDRKVLFILSRLSSWGYVVIASQYRGNDGGEGQEEFGGADIDDVLNLIPCLAETPKADTSRIGIYGWSRGGMMTYLALQKTNRFKAAVVGGGLSDLYMMMDLRKDTFETVYIENIPHYLQHKKKSLDERSAIKNMDKICKTTPILILHGTADWRVHPNMALDFSKACISNKIPHRLIMYEGGDHGLWDFKKEVNYEIKRWFDKYLKVEE